MLRIYKTLEEVPEALREHYEQVDGKYAPKVSDDHPLVTKNKTLLNEKTAADSKVAGLETQLASAQADVQSAKANGLPRGHVAVPKAEAELLEKVKAHGTAQEVEAKLTEHKSLKENADQRKREDTLRTVARELQYNPDAFILLQNLPDFEIREKDGKKTVIAKIKEGENVVEKPAQEFIESAESIAPLLPALKNSNGGTKVIDQGRDNSKTTNLYDRLRDETKNEQSSQSGLSAIEGRFGFAKTA